MLFKTLHGSHLYGLAHEESDTDYYVVVNTHRNRRARYAKQTIVNGIDTMTVDFGTWINMCQSGVPQALEAMFSQMPEVDQLSEFRNAFRVGDGARDRYYRAIDNFTATEDFKKNRHALRLALNIRDALRYGRFNPTLLPYQVEWVDFTASCYGLEDIKGIAFGTANS